MLFSVAYVLAFFGFFRVNELTVVKQGASGFHNMLNIQDIRFIGNNKAMLILLRFSKTDQLGEGVTLKIGRSYLDVCPVLAVQKYLNARSRFSGPLFCHYDGKPLTRFQFVSILQKVTRLIDPNL